MPVQLTEGHGHLSDTNSNFHCALRKRITFTENGTCDHPDRSLKRTPKKEKAMTMLNLPLKKKQKQTHQNRSETVLTPTEEQSSG